jgi:hypothetical protein
LNSSSSPYNTDPGLGKVTAMLFRGGRIGHANNVVEVKTMKKRKYLKSDM